MRYTNEVTIRVPVQRVVELFDDPDNMKKWMPGLLEFEPLSGTPGQPGAKSRLKFRMKNREIEMIETVTVRNLPDEFSGTYETRGVYNSVRNRFIPIDDTTTKYIAENEFRFTGMMKLFGLLMPGAFRRQSQEYLNRFRDLAEREGR